MLVLEAVGAAQWACAVERGALKLVGSVMGWVALGTPGRLRDGAEGQRVVQRGLLHPAFRSRCHSSHGTRSDAGAQSSALHSRGAGPCSAGLAWLAQGGPSGWRASPDAAAAVTYKLVLPRGAGISGC